MEIRGKLLIIFTVFLSIFLCGINVYALKTDVQKNNQNYLSNSI